MDKKAAKQGYVNTIFSGTALMEQSLSSVKIYGFILG